MKRQSKEKRFVICIRNEDCDDLVLGKVYRVLTEHQAAEDDDIRVIDESGEDYLYPAKYFVPVELPKAAVRVLSLTKKVPA